MGWFCGSADEDPVNIAARAYTPKKKRRLRTPWTSSSDKRKAREALLLEGEDKKPRGHPHADTTLKDLQEQIDRLRQKNDLSPSTAMGRDNNASANSGSSEEPLSPLSLQTLSVPASCTTTQSVLIPSSKDTRSIGGGTDSFGGVSGT
jgi:hypothetical protein